MNNFRQKAISGFSWNFIENFFRLGTTLVVGVILARLLSPKEFGLVGIMTVFIAVSNIFVNSGFAKALIRKQVCSQKDYSTVFIINFVVSLLIYSILFISSESIGNFFEEPNLELMIKVLALGIIINGFSIVQTAIITKNLDFKLLTKISIISTLLSSIVSLTLAYWNFGAWSLIIKTLMDYFVTGLLMWVWNKWIPSLTFSLDSFKDLFGFGSKLMLVSLIDTVYRNVYTLVVGKYFSATELGYYSRADAFKAIPSENIASIVINVSFPLLSKVQANNDDLLNKFKLVLSSTMFITCLLVFGMAASAESIILGLIGENWRQSVLYLQLLCFVGFLYPQHALNLMLLNIIGKSEIFLKLEVYKKILAVPVIITGIFWGIVPMILAMIVHSLVVFFLNTYYTGRIFSYGLFEQTADLIPSLSFSLLISTLVYFVGYFLHISSIYELIVQIVTGFSLLFILGEFFRIKDYIYLREIILERYYRYKR